MNDTEKAVDGLNKAATGTTLVLVDVQALSAALAAPFDRSEIKWKPAMVSGNRALALAYVDARVIQDRLDDVLGPLNWQDDYECLPGGSVTCKLKLRLGNEWIVKMDVGSPSEQSDDGDKLKAAFSDALKRAAVKFGIGRFLYRLPSQWVDYDPQKRKFVAEPKLPDRFGSKPQKSREAEPKAPSDGGRLRIDSLNLLKGAAKQGNGSLNTAWGLLSPEARKACQEDMEVLKAIRAKAKEVDSQRKEETAHASPATA